MRKAVVSIVIFSFLFAALLSAAPAFGEDEVPVITKEYGNISQPAANKYVDLDGANFDLTRGDLTVSYTIDMSNYAPLAEQTSKTFEVGIFGDAGKLGWMACNAPGVYNSDPTTFDSNDRFFLAQPWADNSYGNYNRYITSGIIGDWVNMKSRIPNLLWYNERNYAINFDRGTATGSTRWGLIDGKNVNTGGKYNVTITYHAIDSITGVMFATVNGLQQGFYNTQTTVKPQFMPCGKQFSGATDWVQVFVNLPEDANFPDSPVKITNLKAVGTPRVPAVYGLDPMSAEQGDVLDTRVNGESFRNDTGISVNLFKAAADGTDTSEVITADPVTYWTNHTVIGHLVIPDQATPGPWNVTYKHDDDPVVARKDAAFTVHTAPPKVVSNSVTHAKRKQTFTMNITGMFFRNVPMTVQLKRGDEAIDASSVTYKNDKLITATFTIPSTATIAADWHLVVQHNDDSKRGVLYYAFCVEAKIDISPSIIWQHAPGFTDVKIYSESGFDATQIIPLTVSLGGTLPFWWSAYDMNWDGRKDLRLHYFNMFVTIPIGWTTTVAVAGATNDLVPVKGYDTVLVYWFLW